MITIDVFEVDLRTSINTRDRGLNWGIRTSARERCIKGMLFTTGRPTPMTVTLPPRRAAKAAVQMLLSTPVHSRTLLMAC